MSARRSDPFCALGLSQIESQSEAGTPVQLLYLVFSVRFLIPTDQAYFPAISGSCHAPFDGFPLLPTFFSPLTISFFSSILHR
jgi:hypothetical protein